MSLVRERTISTKRPPLVGEVPNFADIKCHVVSVTDPYVRILGFLDHSLLPPLPVGSIAHVDASLNTSRRAWVHIS
jgi:hypothetical protein